MLGDIDGVCECEPEGEVVGVRVDEDVHEGVYVTVVLGEMVGVAVCVPEHDGV